MTLLSPQYCAPVSTHFIRLEGPIGTNIQIHDGGKLIFYTANLR